MNRHIVIIGGGVLGCLTAMKLHQKGVQVTLIERGELGAESSWAGGGILFPLLPWNYSEPVNQLAMAGATLHPDLAAMLLSSTGIDPEYMVSGLRILPPFDMGKAQQWCSQNKIQMEIQGESLWLPTVAQLRNPRLIKALKSWLHLNQITIRNADIAPLVAQAGNVTQLVTVQGETLQCDQIVITAGAWSQPLLGNHALDLELKPMRGQMLLFKVPAGTLQNILYCDDFYLIPRRDGHILAGSTVEDVGFDKTTSAQVANDLHRKAARLLPVLADQQPIKHWSGLRPGSPDNIPVIGRHPDLKNVWLNTGHFRYGVTMAPASVEKLVALMPLN